MSLKPLQSEESLEFLELTDISFLDSLSQKIMDRIVGLAARIFKVPVALLTLNGQTQPLLKASFGLDLSHAKPENSSGSYSIYSEQTLIVADVQLDSRFANHPLLNHQPGLRFYAGVPLHTSTGYHLGTLCLVDWHPRFLSLEEQASLEDLALLVAGQLEQNLAALKLTHTTSNLRAIFNSRLQAILLFDRDLRLLAFNPLAADTVSTVWGRQLRVGQSIYELVNEWELDDFKQALAGQLVRVEKNVKDVSGNDHWFEFSYDPILDENHEVSSVCLSLMPINERKAARALAQSVERFRSLVQHSSDIITLVDAEGVYHYISPSVVKTLGYQPQELVGQCSTHFIHPQDLPAVQAAFDTILTRPEESVSLEFRHRRANDEWVYFEAVGSNHLANPSVNGIVLNARDITARKQFEQQMHLLERALANSTSGILITDATLPDNPLVYVNAGFERITGYSAAEVLGRNCRFLQGPERNQSVLGELKAALREKRECQLTIHNYRKDGTPFWNELKISPVRNSTGQVTHFIGIQTDITDRRQAEALLAAQNKVLELIACGQPLAKILTALTLKIEEQASDMLCSIMLLDESTSTLWLGAAPNLAFSYLEAINGVTIGPKVGSCGTAAFLGKMVSVADIANDPLWEDYRELALSHNLKACWSQPIFSGTGKVLGTFAMYYHEPRQPSPHHLQLIKAATHIAGIAIESRQREAALQRSEEQFRLIFELTPTGMAVVGLDGRFLRVNTALCDLLGYSVAELLSFKYNDITYPPDRAATVELNKKLLAGEITSYQMEKCYIRKDRQLVTAILQVGLLKDAQGQPLHFVSQLADVTERHRAEEQLAAEKERLAVTLSSIGDGVITTDTAGRILLLNQAAEELTGYSQAEALGQPLFHILELLEPKTRRKCDHQPFETLKSGQGFKRSQPVLLVNRTNKEYFVIDTSTPIQGEAGQMLGTVIALRDVTEQQRVAEEHLKTSKLEALGLLAGGIAHDFNNILTAILSNLSLARSYTGSETELSMVLEEAQDSCRQARDLTGQLLTFARGGAPIKETALLPQLIEDSTRFVTRGSGVRCVFKLAEDLWPVEVDKGQLSQVIQNLTINAMQAMPNGGIIQIQAVNFQLKGMSELPLKAGNYVRLSVEDQGIGIAEEHLPKIFDPYFTTKERGSGLGLASCYSIIKKHDGYISAKSKVGVGTTFEIYLPAKPDEVVLATRNASPEKTLALPKAHRLLLMDDEASVRRAVSGLLRRLGYDVEEVEDGLRALATYRRAQEEGRPFELVIMDLTIPGGMGGKETIQKLRELDPQVKAIVSSGYSESSLMAQFQEYGFRGVVTKPYTITELVKVLDDVIAN
jgi:PAS domain S-box-containing protein